MSFLIFIDLTLFQTNAQLNVTECCYDGGDCYKPDNNDNVYKDCIASCKFRTRDREVMFFGNYICDSQFDIAECCYDSGDCSNTILSSVCPTCPALSSRQSLELDNFYCNPHLNTIECCFDIGDCSQDRFQCLSCTEDMSWFRDNICDADLNSVDCCYDGGDCPCPSCPFQSNLTSAKSTIAMKYPGLPLYSMALGNLQCDRALDTPECCHDSFDCQQQNRSDPE